HRKSPVERSYIASRRRSQDVLREPPLMAKLTTRPAPRCVRLLRYAPDLARVHLRPAPRVVDRAHAVSGCPVGRMRHEVVGPLERQRTARGLDMFRACGEHLDAPDLLVHALQGRGKDLLAPERLLGRARKALPAR